jgi:hypothetical protein
MNTNSFFTSITDLFAIGAQDFKLGTDNYMTRKELPFHVERK